MEYSWLRIGSNSKMLLAWYSSVLCHRRRSEMPWRVQGKEKGEGKRKSQYDGLKSKSKGREHSLSACVFYFLLLKLGYATEMINPNPSPTTRRFGFILFGAGNRTWTCKSRDIWTWTIRVCQFHHTRILTFLLLSTVLLKKDLYGKDTCGTQNRRSLLFVANDFDHCAISPFLYRPLGAYGLNAAIPPLLHIKFIIAFNNLDILPQ